MSKNDPVHPIIDRPYEYEIVGFSYERDIHDWENTHFDLALRKGNVIRRLRFLSPRNIKISRLPQCIGMVILDVSSRQMEGINVEVANYENCEGSVELWARDVIDLDEAQSNAAQDGQQSVPT